MKTVIRTFALFALLTAFAGVAQAEVTVTLSDMHICCGACVRGIDKALANVQGVKAKVSQDDSTTVLTASDTKEIQLAVNALAAAGYHGKSDNEEVAVKDNSGAKSGNVSRLEVSGAHNCCGACAAAIREAVKAVPGVTGETVKSKELTFVVEGDFNAAALVKSLNDAGFHVTVK